MHKNIFCYKSWISSVSNVWKIKCGAIKIHSIHNIRNDRITKIYLTYFPSSLLPDIKPLPWQAFFCTRREQLLSLIFIISGVGISQNIKTLVFIKINTHDNNNINITYLLCHLYWCYIEYSLYCYFGD